MSMSVHPHQQSPTPPYHHTHLFLTVLLLKFCTLLMGMGELQCSDYPYVSLSKIQGDSLNHYLNLIFFIQKVWIFVKLNLRKLIPVKLDKASSNMPDFEACYVILLTCLYRVCYFSGSNSEDYIFSDISRHCPYDHGCGTQIGGCFTSESTVETLSGLKKMSELGK